MIRLTKLPLPNDVADAIQERTNKAQGHLAAGEEIPEALDKQYRHPEVKALLKKETHEKCAYCESKITAVYWGDVEHIEPKALRPELTFDYSNLTLACAVCNNGKRTYSSATIPLLNPYVDDPATFLVAVGPMVKGKPGEQRGMAAETVLKLNRKELLERRHDHLQRISHLVNAYGAERDLARRDLLRMQLDAETEDDREYAFATRCYIAFMLEVADP